MIAGIHQPHYLPWLRYIDKIARSDVFVLLDDADYTKNGWQNRNKIKCAQGWMYLTVPVRDAFGKPILEVQIDGGQRWRDKHLMALKTNYARAPFFGRYFAMFEAVYGRAWDSLVDLNLAILRDVLGELEIRTKIVRSSELGVPGRRSERLVDICRHLGATAYLTGDYAAGNHLDPAVFEERGIELQRQGWECATYGQQHAQAGFVADLSVVDLLFNEGPAGRRVLERSRVSVLPEAV